MGIFGNIMTKLQNFATPGTIPIGDKIFQRNTVEFRDELGYDFGEIQRLLTDEKIYSLIALTASLVSSSFKGVSLLPESRYTDKELTPQEEEILTIADRFVGTAVGLNYKRLFFSLTWNIALHGDEIYIYEYGENENRPGISRLVPVPLDSAYFLDERRKEQNPGETVYNDNILAIRDEQNNVTYYEKEEFEHMSYQNHGIRRTDITGRTTFNVWSLSPGNTLRNMYKWKLKTMENDVAWKNKLMPRILHVLKMPDISPARYPGATQQEKTKNAMEDAKKIMLEYKRQVANDTADADMIETDAVDTKILEANSTNYQLPNETITQINDSFNMPFGISNGQLGGQSGTSMAGELDSVFQSIRIDSISRTIADALGRTLRKQLIIEKPGAIDIINRVYLHVNSMLPVHQHTTARALLDMSYSGVLLKTEMRELMGLPRVPQLPADYFADVQKNDAKDSPAEKQKNETQTNESVSNNNGGPEAQRNTNREQRD